MLSLSEFLGTGMFWKNLQIYQLIPSLDDLTR